MSRRAGLVFLLIFIAETVHEFHGYAGAAGSEGEKGHSIAELRGIGTGSGDFRGQRFAERCFGEDHGKHVSGCRVALPGDFFDGEKHVVFNIERRPHDLRIVHPRLGSHLMFDAGISNSSGRAGILE